MDSKLLIKDDFLIDYMILFNNINLLIYIFKFTTTQNNIIESNKILQ